MSTKKYIDHRSPMAKARDAYLESDEGIRAGDPTTLGKPPHQSPFLRNRIESAWLAGARWGQQNPDAMSTPTPAHPGARKNKHSAFKKQRARVMYANEGDLELPCSFKVFPVKDTREHIVALVPSALIPCRTRKEAAAWARLGNTKDRTIFSAYRVANADVGHGLQLDFAVHGAPQLVIYHVWTIGTYKNGHPMFDLRAVTTDSVKAKMYSDILRRDKEANGETWYRVHIEPRVANHLYGECMREYREATGRLPDSPPIEELKARRLSVRKSTP